MRVVYFLSVCVSARQVGRLKASQMERLVIWLVAVSLSVESFLAGFLFERVEYFCFNTRSRSRIRSLVEPEHKLAVDFGLS